MTDDVTIVVDGSPRLVPGDITLAAALLNLGVFAFRNDLAMGVRAPLCGMGTCFECRVTVDGIANVRACLQPVSEGMSVESAA